MAFQIGHRKRDSRDFFALGAADLKLGGKGLKLQQVDGVCGQVPGFHNRRAGAPEQPAALIRMRAARHNDRLGPTAEDLDERFEILLGRIARMPVNQLMMMKLLVNQTFNTESRLSF